MAKKTKIEDIDPNFVINSFRQDDVTIPPSARATEVPTEEHQVQQEAEQTEIQVSVPFTETVKNEQERRRKPKNKEQEYVALFLKEASIPARMGKTVYVRKEYHERIQLILRVIGKDEVSLFSYIDNVLAHHLLSFEEESKKLYEMNSPVF